MSLAYPGQQETWLLGSLATPVTLTTAYSGNVSSPVHVEHFAQATFCAEYTTGAGGGGNSVNIQVEGSPDRLQNDSITPLYYMETAASTSSGTVTHSLAEHKLTNSAAATTVRFMFFVPPAFMTMKVSAKETVVGGAAGTLKLRMITSGK